jgi:pimeloyl-ACP methyl ester carboxylesterase
MVPTRFEAGFRDRAPRAARLAARGIACVLLESPFMGRRRPSYQPTAMLATLSDFVLMGGAAIEEARAVAHRLHERGSQRLCLTGVSLGGYLAAVAAALAPHPVALVTVLAPHDGNVVYLDGLSRGLCDWAQMDKTCGTAATERFRAVFEAISLARLPLPATVAPVIALAATHDRYVPPDSFRTLARLWQRSELRWIGGGHVSTILLRRRSQLTALLDALGGEGADGRYGSAASLLSQATKSATSGRPSADFDATTK